MEGDLLTHKDLDHIQELLNQNLKVAEENNRILRAMRKWGRIAFAAKVVIWTVVLIIPVILYPYIAAIIPGLPGIGSASSTSSSLFGVPSPAEVEHFLHPSK